jgi:hypothetical protein
MESVSLLWQLQILGKRDICRMAATITCYLNVEPVLVSHFVRGNDWSQSRVYHVEDIEVRVQQYLSEHYTVMPPQPP